MKPLSLLAGGQGEKPGRVYVLREASAGERALFDESAAKCPWRHVQQSFAWGELKEAYGWQATRLILEMMEADKVPCPAGAATILYRRLPLVGKGILYAPRGPALNLLDPHVRGLFLEYVRRIATERRAILLKIDPEVEENDPAGVSLKRILLRQDFRAASRDLPFGGVQPRAVWRVSTREPPDVMWRRMDKDARYRVRRAQREGVSVVTPGREGVEPFNELIQQTARRQGISLRHLDYYHRMWSFLLSRGQGELFLARYRGEYIAGVLACSFGNGLWGLYAGSGDRYRELGGTYPVIWEVMCWAHHEGLEFYDFGGIPPSLDRKHPSYGLYQFKRSFGGRTLFFIGEYDLVFDGMAYFLWQRALRFHKALQR